MIHSVVNNSTKHQIFYLVTDGYYTLCVHFRKKAQHIVIGQKDGYVHRLTRAFTRQ
jgi:hypothetical protein